MLNDCLTWIINTFRLFFDWLFNFNIFTGVSYLAFLLGAFVVYKITDNLILKSK